MLHVESYVFVHFLMPVFDTWAESIEITHALFLESSETDGNSLWQISRILEICFRPQVRTKHVLGF